MVSWNRATDASTSLEPEKNRPDVEKVTSPRRPFPCRYGRTQVWPRSSLQTRATSETWISLDEEIACRRMYRFHLITLVGLISIFAPDEYANTKFDLQLVMMTFSIHLSSPSVCLFVCSVTAPIPSPLVCCWFDRVSRRVIAHLLINKYEHHASSTSVLWQCPRQH